jgi:hypothetical protein
MLALLEHHGIPAESQRQSVDAIEQAVRDGRGVAVAVHPYWWGDYVKPDPNDAGTWLHVVTVTGVEYDGSGNIIAFIVNDTGAGECGKRLTVAEFERCLEKRVPMVVTKERAW